VSDQKVGDLTNETLLQVLRYDPSKMLRGLVSFTEVEFCNLAVIETMQHALDIVRELEHKLGAVKLLTMAWSGYATDSKVVDAVTIFVGADRAKGHAWLRRSWRTSHVTAFPLCSSTSCSTIHENLCGEEHQAVESQQGGPDRLVRPEAPKPTSGKKDCTQCGFALLVAEQGTEGQTRRQLGRWGRCPRPVHG
jgi:hypothetical protein